MYGCRKETHTNWTCSVLGGNLLQKGDRHNGQKQTCRKHACHYSCGKMRAQAAVKILNKKMK